jgi:hypothetical protein
MNPHFSLAIDLNFHCSIPLESNYGSYAKQLAAGGENGIIFVAM